jgi:hypothetical protein
VVDHRRGGEAFFDADTPFPIVAQGAGSTVHVTACDRKPEAWASATAGAGRPHDPPFDPRLFQDPAQPLKAQYVPLGDNLHVVIHG